MKTLNIQSAPGAAGRISGILLFTAAAVLMVGAQTPAAEQPDEAAHLTLTEVLRAVREHSPDLQIAGMAREEARLGYLAARGGAGPQIEIDSDLYSYDSRRIDTPPQSAITQSHSSEPRVRGSLPLPGDGRMNIETGAVLRRTLTAPDEPAEQLAYSLTPYVSAQLDQPIAAGGRLIETRSLSARDSLARSGYEAAQLAERDAQNQLIASAVQLYLAIADLRDAAAALDFAQDLDRRRIEQAELDRADGLITARQLLQLRIAANRTREAQLDIEENLQRSERRLTGLTGGTITVTGRNLSFDFSTAAAFLQPDAAAGNPVAIDRAERARREAELQKIVNAVDRAPRLSLFARIEPRYPEQRDNPEDLSAVFQGLGDGFDWTAGVSLRWPLYDGGSAVYAAAAEESAVRQAEIRLEKSQRDAKDKLSDIQQKITLLQERIDLLRLDLDLAEQNLDDIQTRADVGQVGSLRLDEARLDVMQTGNSLSQARSELLNALITQAVDAGFRIQDLLLTESSDPDSMP